MLTDLDGKPIPEDDPRIPRPSQIESAKAAADALQAIVENIPGARVQEAELAARMDALITLLVPPGAARAIFDLRVQENRTVNFRLILEAVQEARAEAARPKLLVPR